MKKPITYGNAYREYRNTLTRVIKNIKNLYYHKKFEETKGDIKKTWDNINKLLGNSKKTTTNIFKLNGRFTDDPLVISNKFNDFFANIATNLKNNLPDPNSNYIDYLPPQRHPQITWEPTNDHEIKRIVQKLNNTKAGPDGIPIAVIKKQYRHSISNNKFFN